MMSLTYHLLSKSALFMVSKGEVNCLKSSIKQLCANPPCLFSCGTCHRYSRTIICGPTLSPVSNQRSEIFYSNLGKQISGRKRGQLNFYSDAISTRRLIEYSDRSSDTFSTQLRTFSNTEGLEQFKRVNSSLHAESLVSRSDILNNSQACISRQIKPWRTGLQPQLTVAVDIDEVLGSFLAALNTFVAEQYYINHSVSEYHVYNFTEVWKCSRTEADKRVHAFFVSEQFKTGILPIPGAYQALLQIALYCQLFVVTSRQNIIKAPTLAWIERYYSGIFKEVHFGNHFALEGEARSKSEICRSLGVHILVDDNPYYAMDCAENGIEVLLFDYNDSYPWSKTPEGPIHPLITRVHNWQEVESALRARLDFAHK